MGDSATPTSGQILSLETVLTGGVKLEISLGGVSPSNVAAILRAMADHYEAEGTLDGMDWDLRRAPDQE